MSNDLVVMDNSIVKASYNLSVSEQRLILSALAQIPKGVPIDPKKAYYITKEDFIKLGASPEVVARDIRTATRDLRKKSLFIQTPNGELEFGWLAEVLRYDKNADKKLRAKYPNPQDYNNYINALKKFNLFDSLPIDRNSDDIVVRIVFDEHIVPLLSDLKENFTQFLLEDIAEFGSIYSFRIYQLMMRYKESGWVKIKLDDLRYMLALKDKYEATKDLKVRVIETAITEINEKTSYKVSYELEKTGRKFTHLNLKFKEKPKKEENSNRDPKTIDWVNGQADIESKLLTLKQADFFASKLANDSEFGSKFGGSGEEMKNFISRISKELQRDISRLAVYMPYLLKAGYSSSQTK